MRKIVLALTGLILVVATVGGSFAAWLFDLGTSLNQQDSKVDTIKENYSYAPGENDYAEKNYTMYIYPSAVYLNEYIKYLNDNSADKKTIEEVYGWLDVHVDATGNVTYTAHPGTATVSNSDKATGDYTYLQLMQTYNDYDAEKNSYVGSLGVTQGGRDVDGGFNPNGVYTNRSEWNQTVTVAVDGSNFSYKKYEVGDPELDKTVLDRFQPINNGLSGYADWEWNRYSMRNLHLNDRFGCWNDIAFGAGRYLPIKITVDATFSTGLFNRIVKTSTCDFGDSSSSFHDFLLVGRSYVKWSGNNWTVPRYADKTDSTNNILKAFDNYRVENYFDITEHFQEYADPENVIRLFPFYSNGTNDNLATRSEKKSALRISVVYPDDPSNFQYTDNLASDSKALAEMINANLSRYSYADRFRTLFYSMDSISNYRNNTGDWYTTSNVKYAVYPNLNLDKLIVTNTDGTISAGTLDIHCSPETTGGGWEGSWYRVYSLSSEILKNIRDKYGSGLYNLYIFIGNSGTSSNRETSLSNILSHIDDFKELSGKELIDLSDVGLKDSATSIKKNNTGYSPLYICLEKVNDIKVIGNLSRDSTDAEIQSAYKNEDIAFRRINEGVFSVTDAAAMIGKAQEKERIAINSPYCYLLRNVDFIDSTTVYFQIRSEKRVLNLLENTGSNPLVYVPGASTTGEIEFISKQVFEPAIGSDRFFKLVTSTSGGGLLLELKDSTYKGTYDIIIYFDSSANGYYMYAHRQTNSFIKIFSDQSNVGMSGNYLKHDQEGLLFQKRYYLGANIKGEDLIDANITGLTHNKPLKDALKEYFDANPSIVRTGLIRDSVTGAVVADFSYNGTDITVTFKDFPIRKNYVFYLEPDSKT